MLKPLSAMLSIGSGGPYGAEGPVIGLGVIVRLPTRSSACRSAFGSAKSCYPPAPPPGVTAVFGRPAAATFAIRRAAALRAQPSLLGRRRLSQRHGRLSAPSLGRQRPHLPHGRAGHRQRLDARRLRAFLGVPPGLGVGRHHRSGQLLRAQLRKAAYSLMWWPALGGLVVGSHRLIGSQPSWAPAMAASARHVRASQLIGTALAIFVILKAFRLDRWSRQRHLRRLPSPAYRHRCRPGSPAHTGAVPLLSGLGPRPAHGCPGGHGRCFCGCFARAHRLHAAGLGGDSPF